MWHTGSPERIRPRKRLVDLASHVGLYAAAQVVLVFLDLSWIYRLFTNDALQVLNGTNRDFGVLARLAYGATKVWAVILAIDILWTLGAPARRARRCSAPELSHRQSVDVRLVAAVVFAVRRGGYPDYY